MSQEIEALGLTGRVDVRTMDYRGMQESDAYNKIASVGMFEHVSQANLGDYFDRITTLLKPGGLVLNQGITTDEPDTIGLGSGIAEFIEDYVLNP